MLRPHVFVRLIQLIFTLFTFHLQQTDCFLVSESDVYQGQFELAGIASDGLFVLKAHSPQHGAFTWFTGVGHNPGWMTHCTLPQTECAGSGLSQPVSGKLNVTSVGSCTDQIDCLPTPAVQPGTGCRAFGCQIPECGCSVESRSGCWGEDLTDSIALIQRGTGVGEEILQGDSPCTFSKKIFNAQNAGASAAIVFNNDPHGAILMSDDREYPGNIPAIFVTRDVGLLLWDMIQEAGHHDGSVDILLTNQTENSLRLSILDTSPGGERGHQMVEGDLEFRLEDGGVGTAEDGEAFPYGSFRVIGEQVDGMLILRPKCEAESDSCSSDQVMWRHKPFFVTPAVESKIPFGLSVEVRRAGQDGNAFAHMVGNVVDFNGVHDRTAPVKLRIAPDCRAEIMAVHDCFRVNDDPDHGQHCLSALDDKGYRTFNDRSSHANLDPLFWSCRDSSYCAGDYLTWSALRHGYVAIGQAPVLPDPCEAGSKNGYLYLGPDDWGEDQSLHMCGYGDRSSQHPLCRNLPSTPTQDNPSGWFFNTTCSLDGNTGSCGHSGWFMEGEVISSCASKESCSVGDSRSTLDLHINLDSAGSVSFTYTSYGEQFYDYMDFTVNDLLTYHTQTWMGLGRVYERVSVSLEPGNNKLSWAWVKDSTLDHGDDKATLHEILITGTTSDEVCSQCSAGFCGSGGLAGCAVCPKHMRSDNDGATRCEECGGDLSAGTIFSGTQGWPETGNTLTCEVEPCNTKPDSSLYVSGCEWTCESGYFQTGIRTCEVCSSAAELSEVLDAGGTFASFVLPEPTTLLAYLQSFGVDAESERNGNQSWIDSHSGDIPLTSWRPCQDLDPTLSAYFTQRSRVRIVDGGATFDLESGTDTDDWVVFNFDAAGGDGGFDERVDTNGFFGGPSFSGGNGGFAGLYGAIWGEDASGVWVLLYTLPLGSEGNDLDEQQVATRKNGHWFSEGGSVSEGWGKRPAYDSLEIVSLGFTVAVAPDVSDCETGFVVLSFQCVPCPALPGFSYYLPPDAGAGACEWSCEEGYYKTGGGLCVECSNAEATELLGSSAAFASFVLQQPTTLVDYLQTFGVNADAESSGDGPWMTSYSGDTALTPGLPCQGLETPLSSYFTFFSRVRIIDGAGTSDPNDWAVFNFDAANGGGDFDDNADRKAFFGGGPRYSGGTDGFADVYGAVWGESTAGVWTLLYTLPLGSEGANLDELQVATHSNGHWFSVGGSVTEGWGKRPAYDSLEIVSLGFSVAHKVPNCGDGEYLEGFACLPCNSKPTGSSYVSSAEGTCEWRCDEGFSPGNSETCVSCEQVGFHGTGLECVQCTNMPPSGSHYTSNGKLAKQNMCDWECDKGFQKQKQQGSGNPDIFECVLCTNLPDNARFIVPAPSSEYCVWECAEGFILGQEISCVEETIFTFMAVLNVSRDDFELKFRDDYISGVAAAAYVERSRVKIGRITELVGRRGERVGVSVMVETLISVLPLELTFMNRRLTAESLQEHMANSIVLQVHEVDYEPPSYTGGTASVLQKPSRGNSATVAIAVTLSLLGVVLAASAWYILRIRSQTRHAAGMQRLGDCRDEIPMTDLRECVRKNQQIV